MVSGQQQKDLGGRPPAPVDWGNILTAAKFGATHEEAAALCKVARSTFSEWLADEVMTDPATGWTARETWEYGKDHMKMSLRRQQYRAAMGEILSSDGKTNIPPSVTMMIWMGKNELGQRDKFPDEAPPIPLANGLDALTAILATYGKDALLALVEGLAQGQHGKDCESDGK